MKPEFLYVKVYKNSMVQNKNVYLKDIAKLYSANRKMVDELNSHVLFTIKEEKQKNFIFSILKLIETIHLFYPEVEVINIGEVDFIVHYEPPKRVIKVFEYAKVIFVSLIVFFGAAFAIMTFNTDVGVKEVFSQIYELIMGNQKDGGTILEIAYSIGLPLGIIIFFNHFSKVKLGSDPTPMQVQMRLYEENLDKTLIENASREDKTIDID